MKDFGRGAWEVTKRFFCAFLSTAGVFIILVLGIWWSAPNLITDYDNKIIINKDNNTLSYYTHGKAGKEGLYEIESPWGVF